MYYINQSPKVVTHIKCSGKPSRISPKEMERIKEIIKFGQEITVETSFIKGGRVKIVRGPLVGYEGILVEQKGKTRFGVQLDEINRTIWVDINMNQLETN